MRTLPTGSLLPARLEGDSAPLDRPVRMKYDGTHYDGRGDTESMMATEILRADTDYALRALLEMARADKPLACAVIARTCAIPRSFAYKILQKLVRAGMASSVPGPSGGFRIAKEPVRITLADVTDAIQGPVVIRRCLLNPARCARSGRCGLSARLRHLQAELSGFLRGTSLADVQAEIGAGAARSGPSRGRRRTGRSRRDGRK